MYETTLYVISRLGSQGTPTENTKSENLKKYLAYIKGFVYQKQEAVSKQQIH